MVSFFGMFFFGGEMEKVIFMYYFLFCLVYFCGWMFNLVYGFWNDYGCSFLLSFVGCIELNSIKFCEFLFSILLRFFLNWWFWSVVLFFFF